MFPRIRGRVWLPVHKLIAAVASLVVLAGVITFSVTLTGDDDPCGKGLTETGPDRECIGVSEGDHVFDPGLESVIDAIKTENDRVRDDQENPEDGKAEIPYARIAVMMPMTANKSSAMTPELIKNGLVGAHVAQLRANQGSGPHYQLLLANNGKHLDHWQPVVDQLKGMTEAKAPLVAVMGLPSSTPDTRDTADALSKKDVEIPVVAPVITSTSMKADYLFQTSASNKHFALALKRYLADRPGSSRGFLVSDRRRGDTYARDLADAFTDHFGKDYKLKSNESGYLGETGKKDEGLTQRFKEIAGDICDPDFDTDTVFYAGRDRDLPRLISALADRRQCETKEQIRIMKVGIGLNPVFANEETTALMKKEDITTVGGSDVDPRWWQGGPDAAKPPANFARFYEKYQGVEKKLNLKRHALDDGYAIMYHDAFTVLTEAGDRSFDARNSGKAAGGKEMPTKDDVFETLVDMNGFGTTESPDCRHCFDGASGTFGFEGGHTTDNWPVCKPVPVIEYPRDEDYPKKGDGKGGQPYRTYEESLEGKCP